MPVTRYYRFSEYLKNKFGQPMRRISLDAGFSCPNRDGTISTKGCIFCVPDSFSPNAGQGLSVTQQLEQGIGAGKERGVNIFMAYFQAFTNTYGSVDKLRSLYDQVLEFPEIVGLSVGTRPDCLSNEIIELLSEYRDRTYLRVEVGLQSARDETLRFINRGHDVASAVVLTGRRR